MNIPLRYVFALLALGASIHARVVIEPGAGTVWKYLDEGEPAAAWRDAGFDDSKWKAGKAPLGFDEVRLGTALEKKPSVTYLRREFDAPTLKPGEQLVILLCVDDGAAVSLNGRELGRLNLPKEPLSAATAPLRAIEDRREGLYVRLRLPSNALQPGKNVLAVELHNAADTDLFFDLALKTFPAETTPQVTATAKEVVNIFNKQHYIGPGVTIPDGYLDGGRRMVLDGESRASSGREILLVDRSRDIELENDLAFARELKPLPAIERVKKLAAWVDGENTPPGGKRWIMQTTDQLQNEFTGKAVLIGDWMEQCQSGVCRHRSLVFKILADEAGLETALVRGNYTGRTGAGGHAWNEVTLEGGRRVLVDVMHNGANPKFPELSEPEVVEHYLKVDNTPWYAVKPSNSEKK
jgi:hypothetical protein